MHYQWASLTVELRRRCNNRAALSRGLDRIYSFDKLLSKSDNVDVYSVSRMEILLKPEKSDTYGTSLHYSGQSGDSYFEWQNQFGIRSGIINARKFQNFITGEDTILDFGCGGGHLLNAINAKNKIGVEINPVAIASARNYGFNIYESITDVKDASIDVAVSNHALEHVPYPISALREVYRVLKKDGRLVLCVPIDDWRNQRKFSPDDINHHLNTWTPQLLGNSLSEAGFDVSTSDIKIFVGAWFRGTKYLWRFRRLFEAISFVYGVIIKSRQIIVVVKK